MFGMKTTLRIGSAHFFSRKAALRLLEHQLSNLYYHPGALKEIRAYHARKKICA